ncbi:hypothetical protein PS943_00719 [Pseudomonas fluorescens]|uniref:Uncharacterized protein n=1 Tax=Pseudomonas fluorescens TaxID=294 RepID=A0A5E7VZN7_PSEFL|nr:hypothetical protein [Pseudomonas fluorescens]VVQ28124.1 hypothetical protein PS943_00719 [Pseudomonas fluorescens]
MEKTAPQSYTRHRVEDHVPFLYDHLLLLIVAYARASSTPSDVVALAAFLSLATTLQVKGLSRDALMQCIDGAHLPDVHETPEGLH